MKKQLVALAGAAALGLGAIAGDLTPSEGAQPQVQIGYMVGQFAGDAIAAGASAVGGHFGGVFGESAGIRFGAHMARPVYVAAGARAAFARNGMLMGARFGATMGAMGGPVGLVVGLAAGAV